MNYADEVRAAIQESLASLTSSQDWEGIIRLRRLFEFLGGGETLGLGPILRHLNKQAIVASQELVDNFSAGQFLHDEGQALHRQGKHIEAINAFEESFKYYKLANDDFRARESYYMTALCYRALGDKKRHEK